MHPYQLVILILTALLATTTAFTLPHPHHNPPRAGVPAPWGPGLNAWDKYSTTYASLVLQHHNRHRANHSSPPLEWSDTLFQYAKVVAGRCEGVHDTSVGDGKPESGYGQNFAWSSRDQLGVGSVVSGQFYGGEAELFEKAGLYGQPDAGGMFEKVGHFTQVIWKSTTHVGCVTRDCAAKWPDMRYFTVCDYSPAGNMIGEFAENVLPPGRSNARMLPAYPDPSQDGQ